MESEWEWSHIDDHLVALPESKILRLLQEGEDEDAMFDQREWSYENRPSTHEHVVKELFTHFCRLPSAVGPAQSVADEACLGDLISDVLELPLPRIVITEPTSFPRPSPAPRHVVQDAKRLLVPPQTFLARNKKRVTSRCVRWHDTAVHHAVRPRLLDGDDLSFGGHHDHSCVCCLCAFKRWRAVVPLDPADPSETAVEHHEGATLETAPDLFPLDVAIHQGHHYHSEPLSIQEHDGSNADHYDTNLLSRLFPALPPSLPLVTVNLPGGSVNLPGPASACHSQITRAAPRPILNSSFADSLESIHPTMSCYA